jgi:transcriptional regulator with PAS, ATPase and Fis domain
LIDKNIVDVSDIPDDIYSPYGVKEELFDKVQGLNFDTVGVIDLDKLLGEMELKAIKWALEKAGGNKTKAAELLNLKKSTFFERLKKYNLC